ncbi:MAG: PspA/IM30 family protein [Deltaproteobacteria bacterium]|nr:PspA/IM30 family protein [Deltaproteobacteria bacterium]
MGIFTRFRDIISSNFNAMLDKAEDPEKLIRLMIREMEDTLVEIKAACAGTMAGSKKVQRELTDVNVKIKLWEDRAVLAVERARDDLAREALMEKRRHTDRRKSLNRELTELTRLVEQYKADISKLEDKLSGAREKQRLLVQRHIRAMRKRRAEAEIRRIDGMDSVLRMEKLEGRIEQMEAEAELVNFGRKPATEMAFEDLTMDNDIETELEGLKSRIGQGGVR